MEDDEPFVLGGLESYQMRDELLETLLETTLMQPEKKTEVLKR